MLKCIRYKEVKADFQKSLNNYNVKNDKKSNFLLNCIQLLKSIQIQLRIYNVASSL